MTKSWAHRTNRRKTSAVLMLALLLLLCWCIPVRVAAEGAPQDSEQADNTVKTVDEGSQSSTQTEIVEITDAGSPDTNQLDAYIDEGSQSSAQTEITEIAAPDLTVGTEDVDISTPLTPPEGSAEIVEITDAGSPDTNQLDSYIDEGLSETEFENDSPSVTFTETFNNVPPPDSGATETTPDADPDETAAYITETMQPITVPVEGLIPETADSTLIRDGETLIKTTVTESQNAIQKAVNKALSAANGDTTSITIHVAAGEYNGDIQITGGNDLSDLTLYILADDSYTEPSTEGGVIDKSTVSSGAQGNAIVTGNILISHINVIMAGLYLSKGQNIVVEDADVTYNGTALADTVTVDFASQMIFADQQARTDYLKKIAADENGVVQLDFIAITHAHEGHIGGLKQLLSDEKINIDKIYIKTHLYNRYKHLILLPGT